MHTDNRAAILMRGMLQHITDELAVRAFDAMPDDEMYELVCWLESHAIWTREEVDKLPRTKAD